MTAARSRPRTTRQAVAIRDLMAELDSFQTAQALHAELRRRGAPVGLATLYRQLKQLADAGEVDVVLRDGEATYRRCGAATDAAHHHHLICRHCGRTVTIEGREVEAWAAQVAQQAGFSDVSHTVELFGACDLHDQR